MLHSGSQINVSFGGSPTLTSEAELLEALRAFKREYESAVGFTFSAHDGSPVTSIGDILLKLLAKNGEDRDYIFYLQGTAFIAGLYINNGTVRWSLRRLAALLQAYHFRTVPREGNCQHLRVPLPSPKQLSLEERLREGLLTEHRKCAQVPTTTLVIKRGLPRGRRLDFAGNISSLADDVRTSCPLYQLKEELKVKGLEGNPPRPLDVILKEVFGFRWKEDKQKPVTPAFMLDHLEKKG